MLIILWIVVLVAIVYFAVEAWAIRTEMRSKVVVFDLCLNSIKRQVGDVAGSCRACITAINSLTNRIARLEVKSESGRSPGMVKKSAPMKRATRKRKA